MSCKLNTRQFPASLVIVALLGSGCLGCGSKHGEAEDPAATGRTVPIQIARAQTQPLSVNKAFSGPLEGEEQAHIIARVSERVASLKVHVGDIVAPGQVVIALDKSGPSSQYYQAGASFKNAEKTLERMKSLYGEGAISQQTLDGVQTQFDVAKANYEAAKALVELTSPIAGIVTALTVDAGDLTVPGNVLSTIATIGHMKIIFNISETDVPNFAIGQNVKVYSDGKPGVKIDGKIVQLSKSADSRSRSFEIKAMFPNTSDKFFKPGMFCRVDVQISQNKEALVIPNAAMQSDGVTTTVFLIRNGLAFQRSIDPGISDGQVTAVLRGLAAGDTVATLGLNNLRDSIHVAVVQ